MEFQLQHHQSLNEYSGLISFRLDWFDLLAIQGTLKSLLQNHSSKASILWYSAFFMVQLSHLCIATGKSTALTRQTFIGQVTSLLFNMLSRLVMKCSFGISNFLEEISSLSHSVVFLYFFALITEEGFLIFPCYSLELCIQMLISFLFSFAFLFSSFHSYL